MSEATVFYADDDFSLSVDPLKVSRNRSSHLRSFTEHTHGGAPPFGRSVPSFRDG